MNEAQKVAEKAQKIADLVQHQICYWGRMPTHNRDTCEFCIRIVRVLTAWERTIREPEIQEFSKAVAEKIKAEKPVDFFHGTWTDAVEQAVRLLLREAGIEEKNG